MPEARQFWQTGASGERRHRTFFARQASHALTGRVRFFGSEVLAEDEAVEFLGWDREDEEASWAGVDGPAEATDARVSAAAIMSEDGMMEGAFAEGRRGETVSGPTAPSLLRVEADRRLGRRAVKEDPGSWRVGRRDGCDAESMDARRVNGVTSVAG